MKNAIIILSFSLLVTLLLSFSNSTTSSFVREASLFDTVKKKDSLRILDSIRVLDSIRIYDSVANLKTKIYKENAHASYYHDKFTGRRTASGQVFNNKKFTAAHKTLKFGTKVKVTSVVTNKWVIVTINDRGPFVKGRDIDLSKAAFMSISPSRYNGHIKVNIEILE